MTLLPESNIDRHIERTVKYVDGSDLGLKCACIAASPVIGSYDGTTQQIAKLTRRSVSTVENWAHAHWMYKTARHEDIKLARLLWRKLPPTHFWRAWDIQVAGYNALHYLNHAYAYDWSAQGMMAEFDKDRNAGNAPLQFTRLKIVIRGLADELSKCKDLTQGQRKAVDAIKKEFAE
jgi:hypothetical protein